jgi:antitoxin ParD1/3/4
MATQLTITLPEHLATAVREMIETGRFMNESDVVSAGLEELIASSGDLPEPWMEKAAQAAFDAYKADPRATIPIEDVEANVRRRWAEEDRAA